MNIEWEETSSGDRTYVMYRALNKSSGRYTQCVCSFFHNNEWRQTYLQEPEFQSASSASIGEIPDTVKTVEEAKEYMLAMWRLQS